MSEIQYLLNAFEEASQHADPASVGYGEKRKALLARIAELERENEALRKDAERYRWLRYGDNDDLVIQRRMNGDVIDFVWLPRNEKLDAAIDAALKEQNKC